MKTKLKINFFVFIKFLLEFDLDKTLGYLILILIQIKSDIMQFMRDWP